METIITGFRVLVFLDAALKLVKSMSCAPN